MIEHLIDLAFLSVKRIILINWKVKKPSCFNIDKWLNNYLELISMEQAAKKTQNTSFTSFIKMCVFHPLLIWIYQWQAVILNIEFFFGQAHPQAPSQRNLRHS